MIRSGISRGAELDRIAARCEERGLGSAEARRYHLSLRAMPADLARAVREHARAQHDELAALRALERLGVTRGTLDERRFRAARSEADVAALNAEPRTVGQPHATERPSDLSTPSPTSARIAGEASATSPLAARPTTNSCGTLPARLLAGVPADVRVVLALGRDAVGSPRARHRGPLL